MVNKNTQAAPHSDEDPRQDQLRAGTWSLLGNLLAAVPTADVLALLRQVEDAGHATDGVGGAWATLRLAAERARPERLAEEYQDVFIGVGGGEITPYASWYMTGSLLERPLILLRQDMEALGMERQQGVTEPEDHAAAICEAMALVISDPDVSFAWQREFFQRHIDPWMGRFFKELQEAPSASFYGAVGCLGEEFVRLEQRYFSMLA
ncbi:MAG: molecular chaperone TorD family protein [Aquisalimonadaceae bacterium]